MIVTHLYASIPLLVLLILSLVFYGRGLVHALTFGYTIALAWIATVNQWEVMFFPMLLLTGIIALILFVYAMFNGNWL